MHDQARVLCKLNQIMRRHATFLETKFSHFSCFEQKNHVKKTSHIKRFDELIFRVKNTPPPPPPTPPPPPSPPYLSIIKTLS